MDIPFNVETPVTDPSSTDRRASTHPHEGVDVRHEAFKRSIWRYLPRSDRDFGTAEEQNLALADGEGNAERRAQLSSRRAIQERLSRTARDKLFALVLGTCTSSNRGRISSAFPSTELLDGLIQYFLTSPSLDSKFWFHLPTFSPSEISPILLSLIIAAGAVSTPDVPLRKLGFALHEAGRACQAKIFEEDNSSIRDLQSLRNLMLQLDIGLWSGMSRKMEIAESFLQPLVTMIRRRGSFRNSMYPMIEPRPEDDGQELDDKWKSWVAQESLLRLVYHVFEHDRQSSMALLKPPLISYSEMQLPIPSAERLWRANTAIAWKQAYLDMAPELLKRPSPLECLLDLNCLNNHEVANRTYLYMIWGMIWEFRQMATINAKTGSSHRNGLILPSRYQDLNKSLEDYRISCPTREGSIILELMFIHLNAPLEDIILFAGIEGQGEARNAYPCLREWVSSPPARQALWHAGQILRAARALPKGGLCNFNAISVYHAGLIIWGYSFVNRSAAHMTSGTSHLEWTASQSSHDEIRLVPTPSSDPADPLNFGWLRKAGILACMSIFPFVVNFTSASISSAFPIYASTPVFGFPPKPFPKLLHLLAVNILMLGASNLWWVPLANTFGRRPVILASLLLLTLSSMWAGLAKTFESLLAARVFMGIGGGSADAVAPDVVGEIFFVHQRGRAMAIYTVFLASGSIIGSMTGGYIAHHGLNWLHWTNVILSAVSFVLCLLFQPETLYERETIAVSDAIIDEKKANAQTTEVVPVEAASYQPYTFARSLKIGMYRPGIAAKFAAPFKTLRLPGVWLVSLWYAGLVGATVAMSGVAPQLVSMPPYLWGSEAGLVNTGGLIGTALGCIYAYFIADWTTKRLAKKDTHGFSEPEGRLGTALPSLFIATAGIITFGFVAQNPSPKGWVGLNFGIGMNAFGLMQAPSVGFNYLIESYPSISGDCLVAVTCARAIIAFAWTFFTATWIEHSGAAQPFGIFGMLMGLFGLATIPILIWGKRLRIATADWVPSGTAL
ncbi:MFS general substrate transporter [Aaosphaeria arxii CBS 175.79]|uniref:MFS general substrate transporter n=1 Tax=Aaosphaeria arxii CBS 175.79 TaxID=1450172 RepID=A0A6A5Y856_9PLEO|nr:MFS general substrate transporter [Aaosphaeria arxii CBS 175.79]KAF2021433.1 MFS general substrate transporter [Aaosphaeria arxii CBS 175.79]